MASARSEHPGKRRAASVAAPEDAHIEGTGSAGTSTAGSASSAAFAAFREELMGSAGAANEEIKTEICKHLDDRIDATMGVVLGKMETLVRKLDEGNQARFNSVEAGIRDLQKAQQGSASTQSHLTQRVADLEKMLCAADTAPERITARLDEEDFNRKPDQTLLIINVPEIVLLEDVTKTLIPWLKDAEADPIHGEEQGARPCKRPPLPGLLPGRWLPCRAPLP